MPTEDLTGVPLVISDTIEMIDDRGGDGDMKVDKVADMFLRLY